MASPSGRSGLPVVRPVGQVLRPVLVLAPIHPPLGEGRTALVTQKRARIATNRSAVSIIYEATPDPVPCSIFEWPVDSNGTFYGGSILSRYQMNLNFSAAIDGGFTEWTPWSACSASCGKSTQTRTRTCTNPPPSRGGKDCSGDTTESKDCIKQKCRKYYIRSDP